jgi:hypothetical protein
LQAQLVEIESIDNLWNKRLVGTEASVGALGTRVDKKQVAERPIGKAEADVGGQGVNLAVVLHESVEKHQRAERIADPEGRQLDVEATIGKSDRGVAVFGRDGQVFVATPPGLRSQR